MPLRASDAFEVEDLSALWPGDDLGGYKVLALIGEGAHSRVYRVERQGHTFALKISKIRGPGMRARMRLEASTLESLAGPGLVGGYGLIDERGLLGLLMDDVGGPNLAELVRTRKLTLDEIQDVGRQVIGAVGAAHRHNLVHRDLKPSNILVASTDPLEIRVGDFGLARSLVAGATSSSGGIVGTATYMAPEQLDDNPRVDPRSDLYSIGVVLYELVCGEPPFTGSKLAIFTRSARGEYTSAATRVRDLPEGMGNAIHAALVADPAIRVQDAASLLEIWTGSRPWSSVDVATRPSAPVPVDPREPPVLTLLPRPSARPGPESDLEDELEPERRRSAAAWIGVLVAGLVAVVSIGAFAVAVFSAGDADGAVEQVVRESAPANGVGAADAGEPDDAIGAAPTPSEPAPAKPVSERAPPPEAAAPKPAAPKAAAPKTSPPKPAPPKTSPPKPAPPKPAPPKPALPEPTAAPAPGKVAPAPAPARPTSDLKSPWKN